jgi:predicted nucleic acid-binding protein
VAAYFLDSSALVKLFVVEPGSAWLVNLVDPVNAHTLFVVGITVVEVAAALFRRVRAGTLDRQQAVNAMTDLRNDVSRTFQTVELSPVITDRALLVAETHGLRGYDCVQLAAVLTLRDTRRTARLRPPRLLSSDLDLNAAAQAEGIAVEDPNNHP